MPPPLDPDDLDTGTLALFVGSAAASTVQERLTSDGFTGLRTSHGYLFQHLLGGSPTIRELAAALDVTQQGASKAVSELERLGYAERRPDPHDARVRRVALTRRGHGAVDAARRARADLEERLRERLGARGRDAVRALLRDLLDELGGTEAVRGRRVRPPR